MKSTFYLLAFSIFFCLLAPAANGQTTREVTEKRLRALQDQMTLDVIRISETEELERATLQTLADLDREIAVREELIETNQTLLRQIERSRDSLRTSMNELEKELGSHREQYQRRAIHAYKYGRLHDVALILAAESINQMLIRIRYLRRFADQRRGRLSQIITATNTIKSRQEEMEANVAEAEQLISGAVSEQAELKGLRGTRNKVISELKRQRADLQNDLEEKQQEADELESMIRRIIAGENSARSRAAANPVDAAANAQISSAFLANKGALIWPANGAVIEPFGEVVNPVYGTVTLNPGILISTTSSAEVLAVFDGEVVDIYPMPEFGNVITISHGDFTTLYGNMSIVYAPAGSEVRAGQMVGRAGTDAQPKGNAVFFGIFNNNTEVNPIEWLKKR
ncbi:MAG: peptidoglycan DD-metalloendopeptidase family protein [Bacteroidota bacterium]